MVGVIVNSVAVIIGSLIGLIFKKGIPDRVKTATMTGLGACIVMIGASGVMEGENTLILIASTVLGSIIGTLLNIDGAVNKLGEAVENKFKKKEGETISIAEGFVSATILFCVGAMAVTGSLQAGLTGDNATLFTKSALDMVSAIMMTATLGIGVMLSSVSLLVYQGALALLAGVIAPLLSASATAEMTAAGSLIILMIGTNLMGITKVKVADFLPAIVIAPILTNLVPYILQLFAFFN